MHYVCKMNDFIIVILRYPSRMKYDNIVSALMVEHSVLSNFDGSGVSSYFYLNLKKNSY